MLTCNLSRAAQNRVGADDRRHERVMLVDVNDLVRRSRSA
jgi:hypothetical protein